MYRFNINEIKNGATIRSIDSNREFVVTEKIEENKKCFIIEGCFYNGATFFYYPGEKDCLKHMYSSRFGSKYYAVSVREEDGIVTLDHQIRPEPKKKRQQSISI